MKRTAIGLICLAAMNWTFSAARADEPAQPEAVPPGVITGGTAAADPASGDSWRYQWHGGRWWYWLPENRWVFWDDQRGWVDLVPPSSGSGQSYVQSVDPYWGQPGYYGWSGRYVGGGYRPGVAVAVNPGAVGVRAGPVAVDVWGGRVSVSVGGLHFGF